MVVMLELKFAQHNLKHPNTDTKSAIAIINVAGSKPGTDRRGLVTSPATVRTAAAALPSPTKVEASPTTATSPERPLNNHPCLAKKSKARILGNGLRGGRRRCRDQVLRPLGEDLEGVAAVLPRHRR
ncbi:hypothetical protein E2562_006297 [Oryza meyeriana var. granulata]|uniref:Uncharacterized protein n=1 Tax=Oryza meyeriana var. granulata TaxID=110450 RepID=A0A6G1EHF7_9ORYZ|nr:hypothetical protein E2562_006297 [Oryza meyeriana var. granulata]